MPEPLQLTPDTAHLDRLVQVFNASEMLRTWGARIEFTPERTRAVIDRVMPHMQGGLQGEAINGGMINAMVDLVIGLTGLARAPGGRSATVQLSVNFLRPVVGEPFFAEGWIEKGGANLLFSAGHVLNSKGEVCTSATGVVRIIPGGGAIGGVAL